MSHKSTDRRGQQEHRQEITCQDQAEATEHQHQHQQLMRCHGDRDAAEQVVVQLQQQHINAVVPVTQHHVC